MTKPCGTGTDTCSFCCTALAVEEIDKPACVACKKLLYSSPTRARCGIYPERPDACRTFQCLWTLDQQMQPELRPDRCGVMFASDEYLDVEEFIPEEPWLHVHVDPARPRAWTIGLPWLAIKTFLAPHEHYPHGGSVAVHVGDWWCVFHRGRVRSGRGEVEFGFARSMFRRSSALPEGITSATLDIEELMRRG